MASSRVVFKLVVLVFLCTLVNSPLANAQIQCSTVITKLAPCGSYIQQGGRVPSRCCPSISSLVSLAKTRADRRNVCNCLNNLGSRFTDSQIQNAAKIPSLCHASIPFTIKRNIDCSRVN